MADPRAPIAVVVGTRPEAIKLAPVVRALDASVRVRPVVMNSGQHPAAVRHTLAGFDLRCDIDLPALSGAPNLAAAARHLRGSLRSALRRASPAAVIVQGDTLTAYAGARAAHEVHLRVAHVEAGLRTDSVRDPFPEEWFRRRIARHADWHFAPCRSAVEHLVEEGIARECIHRVGNTGIDSLRALIDAIGLPSASELSNTVVVTLHRRENWDANAEIFCDALIDLVAMRPDLRMIFPVHPNPRIAKRIRRRLGAHMAFQLVDPMEYPRFVRTVARAALVISDSGGIQEEAPHLGTPLLVPRSNTERPECLQTGFVRLVAVNREAIVRAAIAMLDAPRRAPLPFDDDAPFGAGDASTRIVAALESVCALVQ